MENMYINVWEVVGLNQVSANALALKELINLERMRICLKGFVRKIGTFPSFFISLTRSCKGYTNFWRDISRGTKSRQKLGQDGSGTGQDGHKIRAGSGRPIPNFPQIFLTFLPLKTWESWKKS